jgi:hypothetical protein
MVIITSSFLISFYIIILVKEQQQQGTTHTIIQRSRETQSRNKCDGWNTMTSLPHTSFIALLSKIVREEEGASSRGEVRESEGDRELSDPLPLRNQGTPKSSTSNQCKMLRLPAMTLSVHTAGGNTSFLQLSHS